MYFKSHYYKIFSANITVIRCVNEFYSKLFDTNAITTYSEIDEYISYRKRVLGLFWLLSKQLLIIPGLHWLVNWGASKGPLISVGTFNVNRMYYLVCWMERNNSVWAYNKSHLKCQAGRQAWMLKLSMMPLSHKIG